MSPGIKYRADMMRKALGERFQVQLLCDREENILRKMYRLVGPALLTRKWVWDRLGERIAKSIIREKPDVAVLLDRKSTRLNSSHTT
jgi:hypothetical protein